MYQVRESVEVLEKLGENKENIISLLEKLDELGWVQSHWVKYGADAESAFIEIYGDNSYFHIEGKNIEECYKSALLRVKELKVCKHNFKIRKDAFKICENCGQFGTATLEEMKATYTQFSVKDENKNLRFYSDQALCKTCDSKELIQFGLSLKDKLGYFCDTCNTVTEQRIDKDKEPRWGITISPIDPGFHLGKPRQDELTSLSLNVIHSLGRESENSLMFKIKRAQGLLMEHVEKVEKIINPNFVVTEEYMTAYLKKFVLKGKFNLKKDDEQYEVENIEFVFENNEVKNINLTLKKAELENESDQEVLGGFMKSLLGSVDKQN